MIQNINPLWESHKTTDEQVVEYYESVQNPASPHAITVADIGKTSLNSKAAAQEHEDNFKIRKEDLIAEGMDEALADKEAKEYSDELYANTLASLDDLYKARSKA
jgi:hypothetical protein